MTCPVCNTEEFSKVNLMTSFNPEELTYARCNTCFILYGIREGSTPQQDIKNNVIVEKTEENTDTDERPTAQFIKLQLEEAVNEIKKESFIVTVSDELANSSQQQNQANDS